MTAKEYLNRGYRLNLLIKSDKEKIEELESLACAITSPSFDGMPHSGTIGADAKFAREINKNIEKICALKKELANEISRYIEVNNEIRKVIGTISNKDFQTLLQFRFLNYFSWEKIADEMGYSERWIHELKGRALNAVAAYLNEHINS